MPTEQAHRIIQARTMIRGAYGNDPTFDERRVTRFEMLGCTTALVRLSGAAPGILADIRLARRLSSGRVVRLLRENRADFQTFQDVMKYLEAVYAVHGWPLDRGDNAAAITAPAHRPGHRTAGVRGALVLA
jgi:hypothetical protein